MSMYAETKTLPQPIQSALTAIGYHAKDISIEFKDRESFNNAGSDGRRAGVTLINLTTGERKTVRGSWGGSNLWSLHNPVDNDETPQAIPENGAVISWSEGSGPVYARLTLNPIHSATFGLPAGETVSEVESKILGVYRGIKSSYRASEIERIAPPGETGPMIESLINRGYLKRAINGATAITTKGKNVAARVS